MKVTYGPAFAFIASLLLLVTQDQKWVSQEPEVVLDLDTSDTRAVRITFTRQHAGYRLEVTIALATVSTVVIAHRTGLAERVSFKTEVEFETCFDDPRLAQRIWPHVRHLFETT